ncbi:MAG: hypothetical protein K2H46_00415, partial [Muribaculaceae bacterium]|nr:hypothetical protein [Muribaculaceae bacterium]
MSGKKEILVLFAVLIVCLSGCIGEKEEPEWYLRPGDALPQFEVTTIDGRTVSSADSYSAQMV